MVVTDWLYFAGITQYMPEQPTRRNSGRFREEK